MSAAETVLRLIKSRFPGRDILIEQVYRHDLPFRSLCKDYRDCLGALGRLEKEESVRAIARREEYAELLEDLSCEIRDWLDTHDED